MIDIKRLGWDREYWDEVAPEGANRYYDSPHYQCFLKHSSLDHLYHLSSGEWYPIPRYAIHSHLNSSFPRPEPRQVEWDGNGLPPVGCRCECLFNDGWSKVLVLAHHGDESWVKRPRGTHIVSEGLRNEFRPIRTKQQREREELAECIAKAATLDIGFMLQDWQYDKIADVIMRSGWSKNDG